MTTKDMLGLSVAGDRKEEIRERLRPDHIWSIDCREELVPEQGKKDSPPRTSALAGTSGALRGVCSVLQNYLYPLQRLDRAQTPESKVRVITEP